jgi:hypothetical protein
MKCVSIKFETCIFGKVDIVCSFVKLFCHIHFTCPENHVTVRSG